MNSEISIDVCLATYRRPALLAETLQSLAQLNLAGLMLRVVIVDNDLNETGRTTVETFRKSVSFAVIYDVEPDQNIALARNRALSHTQADYFAFVDDDEAVPPDWLSTLLSTIQRYNADVVFGPVQSILPSDAPKWARVQPSFLRTQRATGTQLEHGGSGNVLIRRVALGQPPQLFDPSYGLSGGEDADFFYRLHLAGRRLIWCDEAIVTEHVPASRLTLKWLRQRGFRSGQSFVRVFVKRYPLEKKALWFVMKVLQLIGGIIAAPFMLLVSYPTHVRLTVRIMAALGQLSVVFSNSIYEEYRADRYR